MAKKRKKKTIVYEKPKSKTFKRCPKCKKRMEQIGAGIHYCFKDKIAFDEDDMITCDLTGQ